MYNSFFDSKLRFFANYYATLLIAYCAGFIWVLGLFFTQIGSANAIEPTAGVSPEPLQLSAYNRSIGSTRLTVWGFAVYDAQLLVAGSFSPTDYLRNSFALELTYLRDFEGRKIAQRSLQEMGPLGTISDAQAQKWLAQMEALFPNVKAGDRITGVHLPGAGAAFSHNGKTLGEIKDPQFAQLFFGIWLSPRTSQPKMRRELLGLSPKP